MICRAVRNYSIRDPFPRLPVLDHLSLRAHGLSAVPWSKVSIVAVQHILESTGTLFEAIASLGVSERRIHVLGKHYSTNSVVSDALRRFGVVVHDSTESHPRGEFAQAFQKDVARMWARVVETFRQDPPALVIVLDDGGRCLQNIPQAVIGCCDVIGIEQTTSGVRPGERSVPIIHVATSAAKRLLEPPLIADATFTKVSHHLPAKLEKLRCGVVGLGNIGKAVASGLAVLGHDVIATDVDAEKCKGIPYARWSSDAVTLLSEADYVYGCTGDDIFAHRALNLIRGNKVLFSVSSEDVEFNSLLRTGSSTCAQSELVRSDVGIVLPHAHLRIVNGGFPVNFDGGPTSVASESIQLTRGLLLGAVMQAGATHAGELRECKSRIMLDPHIQRFVVTDWLANAPRNCHITRNLTSGFSDLAWIAANSDGDLLHSTTLSDLLK
jgi:S-adenosylhomocysteine hydrolase